MAPSFPEEDFSFRRDYVRVVDADRSGDHCICLVHKQWFDALIRQNRRSLTLEEPPSHPILRDVEVGLLLNEQNSPQISDPWTRLVLFRVNLSPAAAVCRFPQKTTRQCGESATELFDEDVVNQIRNRIQFSAFQKRYSRSIQGVLEREDHAHHEVAADVVRHICSGILQCPFLDFSGESAVVPHTKTVPNVLQPVFVASLVDHFVIALPYRPFTLTSCLRFSPSLISCDSAKYFVLYQILQAIARFQEQDLFIGSLSLDDFVIREDLWVQLNPVVVFRCLSALKDTARETDSKMASTVASEKSRDSEATCRISEWTTLWCLGKISNYNYLLALNHAAGRTFGHPDYHPIFPWVVDFTSPDAGWRDLTKTKYRLTKGDRQLDLTYEVSENGMVHHIPETFSDLTFYIYNARRVPKSILCQHVRKRWVPAEYPSTLERLYKWTPDECIPDFYSDPDIFLSIHDDLPDLGLPHWCENVQQFLTFHREALESEYVTRNLHHWIDLNFGYKLIGDAAVTAKNVVLSLKIPQKHLKSHGIQALFSLPHPPAFLSSPWFERTLPLLHPRKSKRKDTAADNASVSSLEMDEVVTEPDSEGGLVKDEPVVLGPIDELLHLESLIDFCLSVDSTLPTVLNHYIPSVAAIPPLNRLGCLQKDLHSFACLAVQILSVSHGSANWPDIADVKERLASTASHLGALQGKISGTLAAALTDLLCPNAFPYSALQVLMKRDRVLPLPEYLSSLYQFVCSLDSKANLDALEEVLEEICPSDMDIISTFIRQRLESASDRYKFAVLLLDPVVKYFGPSKSAETFLPSLNRLYSEFPGPRSPEHSAYLQLFDVDFLRSMLIRFGGEVFMRHLTVPLIEKLTDLQELVTASGRGAVDFAVGDGYGEEIFVVDVDEKSEETALHHGGDVAQSAALAALIWLAEKVGPLLTARFITGNLLKSLSLCYAEEEKLKPVDLDFDGQEEVIQTLNVRGDVAAWIVSDTLIQITGLFGQCFIWNQYLSYCAELVKDALRRLSPMNEAGLLGCMEFIPQVLLHVTDAQLMEHLPFQLINEILYPIVELLTSFVHSFPSGVMTRRLLAVKWLNLVFSLASRIGRESAKDLITRPLLVTFFGIFTQLYGSSDVPFTRSEVISVPKCLNIPLTTSSKDEAEVPLGSPFTTIRKDEESGELRVGTPVRISSFDSLPSSPTPPVTVRNPYDSGDNEEVLKELKAVFTEALAFDAYIPFCKLLGQFHMDEKLLNNDLLHEICVSNPNYVHEKPAQSQQIPKPSRPASDAFGRSHSAKFETQADVNDGAYLSKSFATPSVFGPAMQQGMPQSSSTAEVICEEEALFIEAREGGSDRTLRGNWLAYWQHELGQGRRDEPWNIKQIPLQTFSAHSGPVKSISVLDCEYSFMTASKDKTVRLWSIRNCGDGSLVSQSDGLYLDHKRPVTELRFLARERLAASCDGAVNLWDPWTMATVSRIEVVTQASFIDCSPAPSSVLLVAHLNEETCFVSRFDVRCRMGPAGTGQFQVSPNSPGIIRCLVVSPDDMWFACGFSSGVVSVFDHRTGIMSATWKPHESDVLQLIAVSGSMLISIGSDSTVFLWDLTREVDDRLVSSVRGFPEPILHAAFAPRASGGDLIALMANNRIGVVADLLRSGTTITTSKIRHESLKGNFSTVAVLPMNRQILVGNENGSSFLLC
ncbi:WD repeat-containing protein 81 [Hypsibius exemplaris]|uniref:WD repeat-containing protein 81 n=1 Tax=Hypsibius exemplaris TaxID=2072580 RepID=A0A1W0WTI8_HYPEX|nr:WD repeat-containing protein 81 [Hypsibius exemplaris]